MYRCPLQCHINTNLVYHISEDGSEIELKHCSFSKTSVKSPRKYFVHALKLEKNRYLSQLARLLNWWSGVLETLRCELKSRSEQQIFRCSYVLWVSLQLFDSVIKEIVELGYAQYSSLHNLCSLFTITNNSIVFLPRQVLFTHCLPKI